MVQMVRNNFVAVSSFSMNWSSLPVTNIAFFLSKSLTSGYWTPISGLGSPELTEFFVSFLDVLGFEFLPVMSLVSALFVLSWSYQRLSTIYFRHCLRESSTYLSVSPMMLYGLLKSWNIFMAFKSVIVSSASSVLRRKILMPFFLISSTTAELRGLISFLNPIMPTSSIPYATWMSIWSKAELSL